MKQNKLILILSIALAVYCVPPGRAEELAAPPPLAPPGSVAAPVTARGQSPFDGEATSGLSLGIRLGGTASSLYSYGSGSQSKFGFMGGVNVDVPLSDVFSIQPEIDFVDGGSGSGVVPGGMVPGSMVPGSMVGYGGYGYGLAAGPTDLQYLQIPILLRATLPLTGPVHPFLMAGPSISFLISNGAANGGYGYPAIAPPYGYGMNAAYNMNPYGNYGANSIDWGFNFGAGTDINLNQNFALALDLRYYLGLGDVEAEGLSTVQNRGIQFLSGLEFRM